MSGRGAADVPVWLYWEGPCPDWIRACLETVVAHVPGARLLTPEFFNALRDQDRDIDLGGLHVAHRADYVRAFLLMRYGGVWMDCDCVVVRPLDPVLELVPRYDFVGYRNRAGEVANNFMGARRGSRIAAVLYRRVCRTLRSGAPFGWTALGNTPLTAILGTGAGPWHELPRRAVEPVCWSDPGAYYALGDAEAHARAFDPDALCYMFSANMVHGYGAAHPLLHPDTFFSYLLRRSRGGEPEGGPLPAGVPSEALYRAMGDMQRHYGTESLSGPGSSLAETRELRAALPALLRELGARSLLDAPCGDFNWMKEVPLDEVRYTGVDVQRDLVERHQQRHGGPGRRFQRVDLLRDDLPAADCILCRDCLVHLSMEEIGAVLRNFRRSGARYLLTTTFTAPRPNVDTSLGGWRPLNLQQPPFCFPHPLHLVVEGSTEAGGAFADKSLGVWRLEDLPVPDGA